MFMINEETLDYPVTEQAVRAMHPSTSFSTPFVPPAPFALVHEVARPQYDPMCEQLAEGNPIKSGERWVRNFEVYPLPEATIAALAARVANEVRANRTRLLVACDYTQLPDFPGDKAAWAAYRQALRDITKQTGFPRQVEWPSAPQ